jgi:hypothetical protein
MRLLNPNSKDYVLKAKSEGIHIFDNLNDFISFINLIKEDHFFGKA